MELEPHGKFWLVVLALILGGGCGSNPINEALDNAGQPPIEQSPTPSPTPTPWPQPTPRDDTFDKYWIVYCEQVVEGGQYGTNFFDQTNHVWKPFTPGWYPTESLPSGTTPVQNSNTFIELERIPLPYDGAVEVVKREGLVLRYDGPYETLEEAAAAAAAAPRPERYVPTAIVWTQDWDSVSGAAAAQYCERWTAETLDKYERKFPDGNASFPDGYGFYFKKLGGPYRNPLDRDEAVEYWTKRGYRLRTVDR